MTQHNAVETSESTKNIYRFKSARRTITETDIVNFINLVGLHEPIFDDMEFIKTFMPESHRKRFAPAPFLISLAIGLFAPIAMESMQKFIEGEKLKVGLIGGMAGIEARVKAPAYPGDTLMVEVEASFDRKTRKGHTLLNLRHILKNQRDEVIIDFIEKVIFMPAE